MSEQKHDDSVPFYPDHLVLEAKVALGVGILVVVIGIIGLFMPVGLGAPADPMDTPAHIKPEWYFLSLYQLLRFIPKTLGATAPVLAVLLVMVWPFLDHKQDQTTKTRQIRFWFSLVAVIIIIALTIWGEVS
ncbi:MAG TPA: cytochrome b subunit of the bc complex [Chloroflexi bacterium]|nr:MAG: cytochrome b subunit of the bc complex [Chloroflexota bacterium]HDD56151.1 cytochrome b subunit of the bc complex [Chloroflexota bacterium]